MTGRTRSSLPDPGTAQPLRSEVRRPLRSWLNQLSTPQVLRFRRRRASRLCRRGYATIETTWPLRPRVPSNLTRRGRGLSRKARRSQTFERWQDRPPPTVHRTSTLALSLCKTPVPDVGTWRGRHLQSLLSGSKHGCDLSTSNADVSLQLSPDRRLECVHRDTTLVLRLWRD